MNIQEFLGQGALRLVAAGLMVTLSIFLLAETISTASHFGRAEGTPATDTITVSGTGKASMAPDVAKITFSVQHTEPKVADAQAATTEQANAALAFVKEKGIADKDIKTLSYNVYPQYEYARCFAGEVCPPNTPKISGYQVSETIQVTVRNLDLTGDLLQGLGSLEVQNISGPNFTLDNPNAGQDAARANAIDDAKVKAQILARQLGVRLVKIVNFNESTGGYPVMYSTMAKDSVGGMGGAATPEVPLGENEYNSTVSITYEIR